MLLTLEVIRNLHSAFQMADAVSLSPCLEMSNSILCYQFVSCSCRMPITIPVVGSTGDSWEHHQLLFHHHAWKANISVKSVRV